MNLKELYNETSAVTKNFSILEPKMLLENPRRLLILRLCSNLSQQELSRLLNFKDHRRRIRGYEKGQYKIVNLRTAKKYTDLLNKLIQPFTFQELELSAKVFSLTSNGNKIGHKLEENVKNFLLENKVSFEHSEYLVSTCRHQLDFIIPNVKNPKVVIEVKVKNHRDFTDAKTVSMTSIDIKNRYPNIKFIAFVKGKWDKGPKKLLERYVDFIIEDENYIQLFNVIKSLNL